MSEHPLALQVERSIYLIRGAKVMLDYDLALLYRVETRALKQAVRRNAGRFPQDFMFELTDAEIDLLVSQTVIPTRGKFGGAKPMAFTEQGVVMLSSVLRSKRAVHVNIAIGGRLFACASCCFPTPTSRASSMRSSRSTTHNSASSSTPSESSWRHQSRRRSAGLGFVRIWSSDRPSRSQFYTRAGCSAASGPSGLHRGSKASPKEHRGAGES